MALSPDYTSRDRASILKRSQKLAATSYPDWSSEQLASFGNLLLNALADEGDSHNYAIDSTTEQSRLQTSNLRGPVLQHAAFLGYDPKQNSAAVSQILVVLESSPTDPIDIGPNTIIFATEGTDTVEFRPSEFSTIEAGIDPPQFFLNVENAELVTDVFVSNGTENQSFSLRQGPYIQDSLVLAAGGEAYDVFPTLQGSGPDDPHMRRQLTEDDKLRLTSGNGQNGKIPQGQVVGTYKVGGGAAGNVEANTITTTSITQLVDRNGGTYNIVSVTNPERATEGDDRESIESIRERAPRSRNTATNRTIGSLDYINHAEAVSGVERAFLVTPRNSTIAPNNVTIIVIPVGGGQPTETLKARVLSAVTTDNPNNPLTQVHVEGPDYLTVDITATVHFAQGAIASVVREAADAALEAYFAPRNENGSTNTNVRFGAEYAELDQQQGLPFHGVLSTLQALPSIFKIDESTSGFLMNLQHADVDIGTFQFPALGAVVLYNAATGLQF